MDEIDRLTGRNTTQNVTINGNTAGLITSIVGVFAIVFAIGAVAVIGVMRAQDVRDMAAIRNRLGTLEQYRDQHSRRLTELETNGAKNECEGR